MDVSPVLVADLQAPDAVEAGERPFEHPPVACQAVVGLDTTVGDADTLAGGGMIQQGAQSLGVYDSVSVGIIVEVGVDIAALCGGAGDALRPEG